MEPATIYQEHFYPLLSDIRRSGPQVDVISVRDGFDRSDDSISALADQIADRLAVKLGMRLMESATAAESDQRGLWTARQVAAHYDVGVRFVYQHSNELGCIRLGGGHRPRLRFDPRIVRERWPVVGEVLPNPTPTRRRARSSSSGQRGGRRRTYELLEFEQEA
jgi:hypothetical protein